MPQEVYYAIRIVHLLSMAVWFATPLTIVSDLKKSIARGKPHTDVVVSRVERQLSIATIGAILTILSGLGMIFSLGGFGAVSPRIHAGFTLALVVLTVEFFPLKGTVARLGESLASENARDAQPLVKRVGMFAGITHFLKLTILILMVIKIGGR
ncbi:MAG: hypothetical protein HOW73_11420 [Polyangiaceae bacterium]|nr:hypothetical protein [Polyangiaceae bacterium]